MKKRKINNKEKFNKNNDLIILYDCASFNIADMYDYSCIEHDTDIVYNYTLKVQYYTNDYNLKIIL